MDFQTKLLKLQKKNNSLVCVGLDPVLEKLPQHLLKDADPVFSFNRAIIDSTADLVCSYKPNIAFYEAGGVKGLKSLKKIIDYLKKNYNNIPVILDAKRADIGNTNNGYTKFIFHYLKVDAVTLNPYLGKKALKPFLEYNNKGLVLLCKTSNPGSHEFQNLKIKHKKLGEVPLYQAVAYNIANYWNKNKNCLLVVGATYPKELKKIREIAGDLNLLIPGIGAQGGEVEKTVKAGKNSKNLGMIINSSRGIIYAGSKKDFASKARQETKKLKNIINKYR
jgi:orotidine-5'-phosphate decarboxylase